MTDIKEMSKEVLEKELKKQQMLLEDIEHERTFLGKQAGMHIKVSEFDRLDRDAEAKKRKIAELEAAIKARSA